MKKIAIFGSTGSIGVNSIDVVSHYTNKFTIDCLSTNTNISKLAEQIKIVHPSTVIITNDNAYQEFKVRYNFDLKILSGTQAFIEYLSNNKIDLIINSLVGFSGLEPTLTAIKNNIHIALANKESLVTAGELIMPLLKKNNVNLFPIDSEHNAIMQCLVGEEEDKIEKIILTASGGPFYLKDKQDFGSITTIEALNHPKWKMGNKISIDSATLMNKGLEVIEAHWLFNLPASKIDVVIHPQSIIHSMVEFIDGSIKAQLGVPDMRIPIQYALTYPLRMKTNVEKLDLLKIKNLEFFQPDYDKFECLKLAFEAMKKGGLVPTILNAANEIAVNLFLENKIKFTDIPIIIEKALIKFESYENVNIENIFETNSTVRNYCLTMYNN